MKIKLSAHVLCMCTYKFLLRHSLFNIQKTSLDQSRLV